MVSHNKKCHFSLVNKILIIMLLIGNLWIANLVKGVLVRWWEAQLFLLGILYGHAALRCDCWLILRIIFWIFRSLQNIFSFQVSIVISFHEIWKLFSVVCEKRNISNGIDVVSNTLKNYKIGRCSFDHAPLILKWIRPEVNRSKMLFYTSE